MNDPSFSCISAQICVHSSLKSAPSSQYLQDVQILSRDCHQKYEKLYHAGLTLPQHRVTGSWKWVISSISAHQNTPRKSLYNGYINPWQTIRIQNSPSRLPPPKTPLQTPLRRPAVRPTALLVITSPAAALPSSTPSILKRRCAGRTSTTPCRSLSAALCPTSATASSPSTAASSTACRRWASSSTRSTPSPPRSSATSWATTIPTATPPSTTPWSASLSPSASATHL